MQIFEPVLMAILEIATILIFVAGAGALAMVALLLWGWMSPKKDR